MNTSNINQKICSAIVGSVVYGTNIEISDIDIRNIVFVNKSDIPKPSKDEINIDFQTWIDLVAERDAFACEIAQTPKQYVLINTPTFEFYRKQNLFNIHLAESYHKYSLVFLQRDIERDSVDRKNLMNAFIFAWRAEQIARNEKPSLILPLQMQSKMREIRRKGENCKAFEDLAHLFNSAHEAIGLQNF